MATPGPDYGIDAPYVIRNLGMVAVGCLVAALFVPPRLAGTAAITALICGGEAVYMIWSSRVGKIRQRDQLIESLSWAGSERALDVGCGHGLLLIGAAKRLGPSGRAVGVDLWSAHDQAANEPDATRRNAIAEGVADRVGLITADMRALPFAAESFDVVVSSLAVHNVAGQTARGLALAEVVRVLKPGGRVVVQDFRHTAAYAKTFSRLGLGGVKRSALQWRIFPPARIVVGRKP